MDSIDASAAERCPRLAAGVLLRRNNEEGEVLLDDGQQTVRLNRSAVAILERCDGTRAMDQLILELEQLFQALGIGPEVAAFIDRAREFGWLE